MGLIKIKLLAIKLKDYSGLNEFWNDLQKKKPNVAAFASDCNLLTLTASYQHSLI